MTILIYDPIFLEHDTGDHPETAERLRSILRELESANIVDQCQRIAWTPASLESLSAIHEPEVGRRIQEALFQGGGFLDADTVVSPKSLEVGLAASGACASAVEAVLKGKDDTAMALVRPPGHHATPTQSMGFCLFNNVAHAARFAQRQGPGRIMIIDWDVHHGNGTQDIFYSDPSVMFLSIHRYGSGFYPGTGAANETGTGPGLGTTVNVPLSEGTRRDESKDRFRLEVEKAASSFRPELILVSAGFDAHRLDPIGGLGLEVEDFADMSHDILDIAQVHCKGKAVFCLEGGYHWQATARSVRATLETLLGVTG